MDKFAKQSLAEDIIIMGYTVALAILLGIQIASAVVLFRAGHPVLCFALVGVSILNLILFVCTFCEVFVDKLEDLWKS